MIRFALTCEDGHEFDAWFSSGASYEEQTEAGAIICPTCGSHEVQKAPMAPAVMRGRGRDSESPAETDGKQTYAVLKGLRQILQENADDVGKDFPDEARKIHYGEAKERNIFGEASADEAKALHDEGIPAIALPKLPEEHN
jgi:hypothetical protein